MLVYLLRHGEASAAPRDAARPLSPRGRAQIETLGRCLRGRIVPRRILHSDRLRARQSAELLCRHAAPDAELSEHAGLAPDDDVARLGDALAFEHEDLALVGHLPHLGRLASLLLSGHAERLALHIDTGTCVALQRRGELWMLEWMLAPALLTPPDGAP